MTTILYIEDNEDNIFVFMRRLSKKGYDVIIAHDGEAGISMARSERPSLILMDLDLPVVDGWEATRRLKASEETRSIPVIALSAHAMTGDRAKALEAGCDDYLPKPFEPRELVARVDALERTRRGAGVRGLRVVDEGHPRNGCHNLTAMGQAGEVDQTNIRGPERLDYLPGPLLDLKHRLAGLTVKYES